MKNPISCLIAFCAFYILNKSALSQIYHMYLIVEKNQRKSTIHAFFQRYVQDIVRDDIKDKVYDILVKQNGHVYICGDVNMATGVRSALETVLSTKGISNAKDYVSKLMVCLISDIYNLPTGFH